MGGVEAREPAAGGSADALTFAAMQQIASRLWSATAFWHPGDMAWQLATEQAPGTMRVWDDAAWAWLYQPDTLMLQVDPARAALAADVVAWFDDARTGAAPRVEVPATDAHVVDALTSAGYTEMLTGSFTVDQRATANRRDVALPAGYLLRTADDVTVDQRVEAHRRAWRPGALPYVPEHAPEFSPDATSSFSAEKFARVRASWPYAPERDFVITTVDGDVAACCTAWLDPNTGAAEIEPLGVVPEHRRRGLAQALCRAVLDAVAAAGGTEVVIYPRGDVAYPAPRAAYEAAGFTTVNRARVYGRN